MARKKTKRNDNNLAIAYYRFSSHSQNEASIDQQRELAHEWADAHGLKIVREYEDAAISGTKEDRPGFQLMLSEVAKIRPPDRSGRRTTYWCTTRRTPTKMPPKKWIAFWALPIPLCAVSNAERAYTRKPAKERK